MAEKTQIVGKILTLEASAALPNLQRFIKVSSGKAALCGANEKALGVLDLTAVLGESTPVIISGVVLVDVGSGGVTSGAQVTSDANGKAVAAAALSATATDDISATAAGAAASIPDGEVPMTAASAKPSLTMTQPTITISGGVTVALVGGKTPQAINGVALDTASDGGVTRVVLI